MTIWSLGRFAAFAAMLLLGCVAGAAEPFGRLTVDQVAAKLGQRGTHVYDDNDQERYAAGHVPGAKWLDYDHVTAPALPSDKGDTLIFYCANEH